MIFKTGKYELELKVENIVQGKTKDISNNYNKIHIEQSIFKCTTQIGLSVFENGNLINSAIIGSVGGGTGIHKSSQILEDNRILVCCSDSIFCLSIPQLDLLWKTHADQATCFQIFKLKESYIVHGELEISRLDKNGVIMWQKGGADIFTTIDGKDHFEITENYIRVSDWENRKYIFDFDGNIISEEAN